MEIFVNYGSDTLPIRINGTFKFNINRQSTRPCKGISRVQRFSATLITLHYPSSLLFLEKPDLPILSPASKHTQTHRLNKSSVQAVFKQTEEKKNFTNAVVTILSISLISLDSLVTVTWSYVLSINLLMLLP